MYNHTGIASYPHWPSKCVGQLHVWLLVLDGRSAKLAGGLPSCPILSGLSRTVMVMVYAFGHQILKLYCLEFTIQYSKGNSVLTFFSLQNYHNFTRNIFQSYPKLGINFNLSTYANREHICQHCWLLVVNSGQKLPCCLFVVKLKFVTDNVTLSMKYKVFVLL